MRITLKTLATLPLTALLAACAADSSEPVHIDIEPYRVDPQRICLPGDDDGPTTRNCSVGPLPKPQPLPDVTYAIATPTETSVAIGFYTSKGAYRTTVQIGRTFPEPMPGDPQPASIAAEATQVDAAPLGDHAFVFKSVRPCSHYWFTVSYGGIVHYTGLFDTSSVLTDAKAKRGAITFTTTQLYPVTVDVTDKMTAVTTSTVSTPLSTGYGTVPVSVPSQWLHYTVTAGGCMKSGDADFDVWADRSTYVPVAGSPAVTYDYPSDSALPWTHEVQGAAHDDAHWYLTEKEGIFKVDVGHPLDDHDPAYPSTGLPSGHDHIGDPDVAGAYLFAPLEGSVAIGVYATADLAWQGEMALTLPPGGSPAPDELGHAAWCAINPADGRLYTSTFDGVHALRSYAITRDASGRPTALVSPRWFELGMTLNRVQGGEFSPNGHLYLSSDDAGNPSMWGFDVRADSYGTRPRATPPLRFSMGLDRGDPKTWIGSTGQEIEGLTIWDVTGKGAPNVAGQVHVMMNEHDSAVFFKHFQITDSAYADEL